MAPGPCDCALPLTFVVNERIGIVLPLLPAAKIATSPPKALATWTFLPLSRFTHTGTVKPALEPAIPSSEAGGRPPWRDGRVMGWTSGS